ncbi:nuclear transport factor 2 family protein [Bacillus sp. B-jedd]|uniref:nuclear transport factor 2 family protein n=1 Tax=Bacillus sp. B-jedd TaxID=1476857 RepID=UPI000662A803|nr:ester cyclase [Bacillus sp. B-jedd]
MNMEQNIPNSTAYKEIAVSFLQSVAKGQVREAFKQYIATDFHHHNPYFRGDAESIMAAMEENAVQSPEKVLEVKLAIQENEHVAVHSHIKQNPEDAGAAVIHIFRFKDGRIVELWDVGQPVPQDSPNKNGMF